MSNGIMIANKGKPITIVSNFLVSNNQAKTASGGNKKTRVIFCRPSAKAPLAPRAIPSATSNNSDRQERAVLLKKLWLQSQSG